MQIGSIVECIRDDFETDGYKNVCFPVKGKTYTVREIQEDEGVNIMLEEIINPKMLYLNGYGEVYFDAEAFRELLPPDAVSLEELLEEPVTA